MFLFKGGRIYKIKAMKINLHSLLFLVFIITSCKKNIEVKENINTKYAKEKPINFQVNNEDKLFNDFFSGLAIKDSLAEEPYKKYWFDFNSSCLYEGISFRISLEKRRLYFLNYKYKADKIQKNDYWYYFNIDKLYQKKNKYYVIGETGEYLDNDKNSFEFPFEFVFIETASNGLYEMKVQTDSVLNIDFSILQKYMYFTSRTNQDKFEQEGCGDFDG